MKHKKGLSPAVALLKNPYALLVIGILIFVAVAPDQPTAPSGQTIIVNVPEEADETTEEPPPTTTYTCEENDGGKNLNVAGWCQDSYHELGFVEGCSGLDVEEYFCNDENICKKSIETCPTYYHCEGGKCVDCKMSGYAYFTPMVDTGSDCGDWAIGHCTAIGKVYNGASFNTITKCCGWNCI